MIGDVGEHRVVENETGRIPHFGKHKHHHKHNPVHRDGHCCATNDTDHCGNEENRFLESAVIGKRAENGTQHRNYYSNY